MPCQTLADTLLQRMAYLGDRCNSPRDRVTRTLVALIVVLVSCLGLSACSTGESTEGRFQGGWFKEVANERGITFVHNSGYRTIPLLPEINGSGAALADLNGDGWMDVYFVQSGSLYQDEAGQWRNELYFNQRDGSFQKAANSSGAGDAGYGMGVAAGDYDNDGDVDLYVTNVGPNVLLMNDGGGVFEDVSSSAGVDDRGFGTSAAFQDFDQDGFLDLFVANYVNWHRSSEVECYEGSTRSYCPPERYGSPSANRLFRNNGNGTFQDLSKESGISLESGHSFGVVTADFNSDGLIDIYVANDRTPNELWMNDGKFKFSNVAESYSVAADGYGLVKAGMGVASEDFDHDGDFDLLIVNLVGETDTFFRNEKTHFVDFTGLTGLNSVTTRYTRWGVVPKDLNNDGNIDLYIANGGVYPSGQRSGDIYAEPNVLLAGQSSGSFVQVRQQESQGVLQVHTSRGCAVGDIDNDGGLDLVVVNRDAAPYLLVNELSLGGNWLSLEIRDHSGRIAIGSTLSFALGGETRYAKVSRDGSFLSSSDARIHIGLGEGKLIRDLRITWNDGHIEYFGDIKANQFVVLERGKE